MAQQVTAFATKHDNLILIHGPNMVGEQIPTSCTHTHTRSQVSREEEHAEHAHVILWGNCFDREQDLGSRKEVSTSHHIEQICHLTTCLQLERGSDITKIISFVPSFFILRMSCDKGLCTVRSSVATHVLHPLYFLVLLRELFML